MALRPYIEFIPDGGFFGESVPCAALLLCCPRRETEWPTTNDPPWSEAIRNLGMVAAPFVELHPALSKLTWSCCFDYIPSHDCDRWKRFDRLENKSLALRKQMDIFSIPDPPESFRAVRQAGYSLELDVEFDQISLLLSRENPGIGWLHGGLFWGTVRAIELPRKPDVTWDHEGQENWLLQARKHIYRHGVCMHYDGGFDRPRRRMKHFTCPFPNHPPWKPRSAKSNPRWLAMLA